jgi:plastocyanin
MQFAPGAGSIAPGAVAANDTYAPMIEDHRFDPAQFDVPAGRKVKLVVRNLHPTPEEFESHELKREKVIAGKGQVTITIGPLNPGAYKFVGEYHEASAQGRIVAN